MGNRTFRAGVMVASAAILMAAWVPSISSGATAPAKAYTWGINAELSGPVSYYGTQIQTGLKAFVKAANANVGKKGHKTNLVALDNQASGSQAATNQTQLITSNHAIGTFGNVLSSDCQAATGITARYKVPMACLSVNTPNPWVYDLGDNNGTSTSADLAAAAKVSGLSNPKIAVLAINTLTDITMASDLSIAAAAAGDSVVSNQQLSLSATDFTVPVANIVAAKPDVIVMSALGTQLVTIQQQLASSGVTVPILFVDGSANMPQVVSLPSTVTNVYPMFGATPLIQPNSTDKYVKAYIKALKGVGVVPSLVSLNGSVANVYLSAYAFSLAQAKCGSQCTGPKMQSLLDQTKFSLGALVSNYSFTPTNHDPFSKWYVYHLTAGQHFTLVGTYVARQ